MTSINNLFHHAFDAMLVINPYENKIISANRQAEKLFGVDSGKLLQITPDSLFKHSFEQLLIFSEAVVEKGESWLQEVLCETPLGEKISLELSGSLFISDQEKLIILTLLSVSDLQHLHAEIEINSLYKQGLSKWKTFEVVFQEFERENQLILNAAGEGIYGVNANGETSFLNPAALRMLGWSREELLGRSIHTLIHHTKSDGSDYHSSDCPIYKSTHDGEVHQIDNELFWRKDGSSFPVEYTSTPIRDNGRLVGSVVIFRDISERKLSEEKLQNALKEVQALRTKLEQENAYLQEEIHAEHNYKEIVGRSEIIHTIIRQIELVAPTGANVLISGESGTGKELIARAIHQSSDRSHRPLIRVNCASIPRELFESEFFGHVKGAYTGAILDRAGRFELADGGTLFLDEVGEIPLELQSKLLRVLQEQQFERVGDNRTKKIDVRIIAATNKNLKNEAEAGRFREDLFYRLNVFPITSAALRDRKEDIPLLASHYVKLASKKFSKPMVKLSLADIQRLQSYNWPGNIRELVNVIERSVILSNSKKLIFDIQVKATKKEIGKSKSIVLVEQVFTEKDRRVLEKENIVKALKVANGKIFGKNGAAEVLGLKPTTLASRIKKFGINRLSYVVDAETE